MNVVNQQESAGRSPFADLQTVEEYAERSRRLFPAAESLRWYMRTHRAGLEACGALLRIQARLWIRPKRFDAYVLKEGAAAMKREAVEAV